MNRFPSDRLGRGKKEKGNRAGLGQGGEVQREEGGKRSTRLPSRRPSPRKGKKRGAAGRGQEDEGYFLSLA